MVNGLGNFPEPADLEKIDKHALLDLKVSVFQGLPFPI
jgi:hypothetical protein